MSLAPGARLGAYEILGPLGAGGMGEVYRARDTRLGREVAIKVLPADVAADPDRLARFEREAKAVSALNHPHIVTLYEAGTGEAGPYLVLEKIEGQSLRDLLASGPLPVRRLVSLAAQIADGLAKAHSAGIVHRDLKPENVMVTSDGFAKILDFGLAKLVWPELHGGEDDTTLALDTASGMILGTLGYLSPEQAAGRPADERADQFALGALLYEMATRERLFRRETMAESLAATIRDEAPPLRSKRGEVPQQFAWIVERCLAKDPNDRYASTKDLARDLADVRDRLSDLSKVPAEGAATVAVSAARSRSLLWPAAALGGAVLLAAGYFAGRQLAGTHEAPTYRALTFRRGIITGAKFSKTDSQTIYYSAAFGAEPSKLFVTRLDGTQSKPVDLPQSAMLLSVSRKGELLVLLTEGRNVANSAGTLAQVPALGGTPRELKEQVVDADWAPDGERPFVELRDGSLEFAGRRIGSGIFPRVSPRGDRLAWADDDGNIKIADTNGQVLVSEKIPSFGLAWTPDGTEVWCAGSESGSGYERALFAISLKGERRLIARGPVALTIYDVAGDGRNALVSTGAGWTNIVATEWKQGQDRSLDLYGRTWLIGLSADGGKLLTYEPREIGTGAYLQFTDGSKPVPFGDIGVMGLAPRGDWMLVREPERSKPPRLQLVSTGAASPREVPIPPGFRPAPYPPAQWSLLPDDRRMFVKFATPGQPDDVGRLYTRVDEGPWTPVTPGLIVGRFAVSPDGASVAARDLDHDSVAVFSVNGGPARPLAGVRGAPLLWTSDGFLILREPGSLPAKLFRLELKSGRREPWHEVGPPDLSGVTAIGDILLARDGAICVYNYARVAHELFVAQGVR